MMQESYTLSEFRLVWLSGEIKTKHSHFMLKHLSHFRLFFRLFKKNSHFLNEILRYMQDGHLLFNFPRFIKRAV